MLLRYTLIFGLFFLNQMSYAQYLISGKIVDEDTNAPIPFANIVILGTKKGTTSDANGSFKITYWRRIKDVKISFVGYHNKIETFPYGEKQITNYIIKLGRNLTSLNEIIILPSENPAHRIILEASKNRDQNNPDFIPQYTCKSYNKSICDLVVKQEAKNKKSILENLAKDITEETKDRHVIVTESVTERNYKARGFLYEKVLANKVSGLSNPDLPLVPTNYQPFGFYDDFLKILNKYYSNPLAKGSTKRYFFDIADTIYNNQDTIFVITYRPSRKSNFRGLTGVLEINASKGFALSKITASPAEIDSISHITYEQEYSYLDNKQWFPRKLKYEITYLNFPSKAINMKIYGSTEISEVDFNPDLKQIVFGHEEVTVANDAGAQSEEFWTKYRKEPPSQKELKTYAKMDTINQVYRIDKKLKITTSLIDYQYPTQWLDIDINRLLDYNGYEQIRLGFGAHTNQTLSKKFKIGTYVAWGTHDKKGKFGSDISYLIEKKHELALRLSHIEDVVEPANAQYIYPKIPFFQAWSVSRMDFVKRNELNIHSRLFEYLSSDISLKQETRKPLYPYQYLNDKTTYHTFDNTEFRIQGKFAYKERFIVVLGKKISKGTTYPILHFAYSQGLIFKELGNFNYQKLSLGVEKTIRKISLGTTKICLEGGWVNGNAPYFALFNGDGSFTSGQILLVKNTFQTMPLYDFLSDKYVAVFLKHNFENVIHNFKNNFFAPEPVVCINYAIGTLHNPQAHSLKFNTLEKGYWEFGGVLNNIFKYNYAHIVCAGLGSGIFWHPSSNNILTFDPKNTQNGSILGVRTRTDNIFVYKISFILSFK